MGGKPDAILREAAADKLAEKCHDLGELRYSRPMNTVSPSIRLAVTAAFMAILLVVSLIPGRAQPGDSVFVWLVASTPTPLQKMLHLLLYAVLTLLWVWTLESLESKVLRFGIAVSIAICFGAAMEWYQTKIPGRFGTIFDVVLNAGGALIGVLAAIFLF